MFINRILGLYTHPTAEWQSIQRRQTGPSGSLVYLALLALFPSICVFISTAFIGWSLSPVATESTVLTLGSAAFIAVGGYFAIMASVVALGYLIYWMSSTFGSVASFSQGMELAAYAATPLLMAAIALLFPHPVFFMAVSILAGLYSVYLLYCGIPVVMQVPEDRRFIYITSILVAALVLLMCVLVAGILLLNLGLQPIYRQQ